MRKLISYFSLNKQWKYDIEFPAQAQVYLEASQPSTI